MEAVKCQVCGKSISLDAWNREYDRFKQSPDHTYICPNCEARIRAEAQDSQGY